MKPRPKAAPTRPKFWARVSLVEMSAMYALAAVMVAPVKPETTRAANSHHNVGANPITR